VKQRTHGLAGRKCIEQSSFSLFAVERSDHRRRQSSTIVRYTPRAVGMIYGHCGLGIWLANILWTPTAATTITATADTSCTRLFRSSSTAPTTRTHLPETQPLPNLKDELARDALTDRRILCAGHDALDDQPRTKYTNAQTIHRTRLHISASHSEYTHSHIVQTTA
jgi:hypothetical protein